MERKETTKRSDQIRQFILDQVAENPRGLTALVVKKFGISRQAATRYLTQMVKTGQLKAKGMTKDRVYQPGTARVILKKYPLNRTLEESEIWAKDFMGLCDGLRENVVRICEYGFTEMVNNAIDHSNGKNLAIFAKRDAKSIFISVDDDGVGIFKKIKEDHRLSDERQAILELAKGKLTSDPANHSGQGIFFSSRAFDDYYINSYGLVFGHDSEIENNHFLDEQEITEGTSIYMKIGVNSRRKLRSVFDEYTNPEVDSRAFDKTVVPVKLIQYEGESLLSRSQAKRLLARVENFGTVLFDFTDIQSVGPAFADEIFRVYKSRHSNVKLVPIHVSEEVMKMIVQAKFNVLEGAFKGLTNVDALLEKGLVERVEPIEGEVALNEGKSFEPSYRIVRKDRGALMEILQHLPEEDRQKIKNVFDLH